MATRRILRSICLLASTLAFTIGSWSDGLADPSRVLTGVVADSEGAPLVGATVVVIQQDSVVTGTASDATGFFTLRVKNTLSCPVILRVSSVGHVEKSVEVDLKKPTDRLDIQLAAVAVEIEGIKVSASESIPPSQVRICADEVSSNARRSLMPTNPTAALNEPQVLRVGSNHSSKLRVHGTNPEYYINGIGIGSDPNHYDMFSIIPGSILEEMRFYSSGTSARYGIPSIMELETPSRFEKRSGGELNLSLFDITGHVLTGNEDYFLLGSLRKSVLDKLVKMIDARSERRTLPPTNFQDAFISSGVRLSPRYRLMLDQYFTRDHLDYTTEPSSLNSSGINIFQHTNEQFLGARFDAIYDNLMLKVRAARKSSEVIYDVKSKTAAGTTGDSDILLLDLSSSQQVYSGRLELDYIVGRSQLTVGGQFEHVPRRYVNMEQNNWNFLPPDAHSDNPYVFQDALNRQYGHYRSRETELNGAGYFSLSYESDRFVMESGIRAEYFSNLRRKRECVLRHKLTTAFGDNDRMELFMGTFVENPVGRILEPYQVLVHSDLDRQEPIRTRLISASYTHGCLKAGAFSKRIDRIPTPVPVFREDEFGDDQYSASVERVEVYPIKTASFYGADITLQIDDLFAPGLDLYSFYGYSHAKTSISLGPVLLIPFPYELNAPHRLFTDVSYAVSKLVTIGGELAVRSGYLYTPSYSRNINADSTYSEFNYLTDAVKLENSARFPVNATLNLHVEFDFGSSILFFSIANVTNRANPIISTTDGFVYDAGILPMIGLRYRF